MNGSRGIFDLERNQQTLVHQQIAGSNLAIGNFPSNLPSGCHILDIRGLKILEKFLPRGWFSQSRSGEIKGERVH